MLLRSINCTNSPCVWWCEIDVTVRGYERQGEFNSRMLSRDSLSFQVRTCFYYNWSCYLPAGVPASTQVMVDDSIQCTLSSLRTRLKHISLMFHNSPFSQRGDLSHNSPPFLVHATSRYKICVYDCNSSAQAYSTWITMVRQAKRRIVRQEKERRKK